MHLVKIEGDKYSFFEGKEKLFALNSSDPISKKELEEYRKDPHGLMKTLNEDIYYPKDYTKVNPTIVEAIFYDASEESIDSLEAHFSYTVPDEVKDVSCFIVRNPKGNIAHYGIEDFMKMYKDVD